MYNLQAHLLTKPFKQPTNPPQIMYNSRKMHKPKDKWRSREYGFVDFATPEEAARAIVWMDGVELPELMKDNAGIIVQYAKPAGSGGMD